MLDSKGSDMCFDCMELFGQGRLKPPHERLELKSFHRSGPVNRNIEHSRYECTSCGQVWNYSGGSLGKGWGF